jgi:glyoxylate reductase
MSNIENVPKPYVFISMKVPDEAIEMLKEVAEVSVWNGEGPVPKDILIEEAKKADALYTMLCDPIDEGVLRAGKRLKIVSNLAVGYDNIDLKTAKELGIVVTNTPEVLTEATADLTFSLLMATGRRIVESATFLREGKWKSWNPMLMAGQDIYGATMGIIGMGRIGEAVARRASGFNMKVLYHNRSRKPEVEEMIGVEYRSFEQLLQESDFVVVLTPLTPETKHLFGKEQFKLMKNSATFINASRGAVVIEKDLYDALTTGEIWAAGLDVFEVEPVPLDNPLLQLDNVVAIPHIGSASIRTRTEMAKLVSRNILAALQGERPPTLVDEGTWRLRNQS